MSLPRSLLSLLSPAGAAYGLAMRLRAAAYEAGRLPVHSPPAPTVSVGNISMGGSGKTPVCGWILARAAARGITPALLTRGYKSRPTTLPYLVTPDAPPREAGDEPLLLAASCPQAKVLVDPMRSRAARLAWKKWQPGLFVLDDGFQHLSLARHVNLALFSPFDLGRGWNRVFPAGTWREGKAALSRASAFLVKAGPETFTLLRERIAERLEPLGKPVFPFELAPTGLEQGATGQRVDDLGREPYLLATGVARPDQVAATARTLLGYPPEAVLAYPDHHFFGPTDAARIERAMREASCTHVVVTAKDAVKLARLDLQGVFVLQTETVFADPLFTDQEFGSWLDSRLQI